MIPQIGTNNNDKIIVDDKTINAPKDWKPGLPKADRLVRATFETDIAAVPGNKINNGFMAFK